jgi:hypothetical protein
LNFQTNEKEIQYASYNNRTYRYKNYGRVSDGKGRQAEKTPSRA